MTSNVQTTTQQFLTFRLDAETFAIDVRQVREILDVTQITCVPQMPAYMLGVINLRGNVVPVIDLRLKFGMPALVTDRDNCIIVIEVDFAGETTVVGARADAVSEVLDLPQDAITPPPRLGTELRNEFIRGMGKKDEGFIILLDIDHIFSSDELVLLQEVAPT